MIQESENSRKDLKKYYKYVFNCSKCSKPYGCDIKKIVNTQCPVCLGKVASAVNISWHKARGQWKDNNNYKTTLK